MASPLSLTDCPQCGGLCLGAVILPCGHLSCRKCCHHLLQQQGGPHITCHWCAQDLPLPRECSSVSQVVEQLGTDPVTDHLVQQRLLSQGRVGCQVHGNSDATMVCEDCHDYFCGSCCDVHRKQTATSDHVLRLLPTALCNTPLLSCVPFRPRCHSSASADSSESISKTDDPLPYGQLQGKTISRQRLQKQVKLSARGWCRAASIVRGILSLGKRFFSTVQAKIQSVQTYITRRGTYDVCMTVKSKGDEGRHRHTRDTYPSQSVTVAERIKTKITGMRHEHPNSTAAIPHSVPRPALLSAQTTTRARDLSSDNWSHTNPATSSPQLLSSPISSSYSTLTVTHTPSTDVVTATPHRVFADLTATPHRVFAALTAIPQRVFAASPASVEDVREPWVISIVCTQDERLVMTDIDNSKVKVVKMSDPHTVTDFLTLEENAQRLALLSDGLIAVTTFAPIIYLLTVNPSLMVSSRIQTDRRYAGVADALTDLTLLVSCGTTDTGVARVDVITREGTVVRTVVDSTTMTELAAPLYLCSAGDYAMVSDWQTHAVYKVDVSTGQLVETLTHEDLSLPCQVCVGRDKNTYIASLDGQCVLVMSTHGHWRCLLCTPDHTDQDCDWPSGMCVTMSGRLIVAWRKKYSHSVVIGYDLTG